jgi:hypothetical protein
MLCVYTNNSERVRVDIKGFLYRHEIGGKGNSISILPPSLQ